MTQEELVEESMLLKSSTPRYSHSRWLLGVGCIVVVAIIWTFASVLVQYVFHDLGFDRPFFLTYVANSLFAINLPLYYGGKYLGYVQPGPRQATFRQTLWISAIVAPLWFIANFTYNISLNMTSVTSSTIISSTSAMFTFVLSIYYLGEVFTLPKLGGVALCMLGNSCTVFNDTNGSGQDNVWGDILALFAAFMYGAYTTAIRWCIPDESKVSLGLFFGLLGLLNFTCLLPIVLVLHWTGVEGLSALNGEILGLLTVKGLFDNVLSDYLWALAMLFTTPTVATIGLSLTVPFAIVSDFLFHSVTPTIVTCLASVFVIAGFVLINVSSEKSEASKQ
ncbi:Drug/Metabolite Transporter (DMT) Superfamily [Thraustotheca clavata]|uniref:Drug/Metabolite Transporter (DMT) Superfamily n=1 Tax=Thraustotheca clavata TaxID=74557 RepID=A0A1V9YSA1_9STRA|nr:Drug/Metabolite Transporter (DMT) Superfamily [Thraustotheca clavata]